MALGPAPMALGAISLAVETVPLVRSLAEAFAHTVPSQEAVSSAHSVPQLQWTLASQIPTLAFSACLLAHNASPMGQAASPSPWAHTVALGQPFLALVETLQVGVETAPMAWQLVISSQDKVPPQNALPLQKALSQPQRTLEACPPHPRCCSSSVGCSSQSMGPYSPSPPQS